MAIVGEPCNVDAHAKIPALFITMLCPRCAYDVCTHVLYNCKHWLWLYTELEIVAAPRHEVPSRFGDQQQDFEAKSRVFCRE